MRHVQFWRHRFNALGEHSVGPGDTKSEEELELHRQVFLSALRPFLENLKGPVLDFGCGVGRWVMDLPRPYVGLDLTPEHIEVCRLKFGNKRDVEFHLSDKLETLPDKSFKSIFTLTVLQHIVEPDLRKEVLQQFQRMLSDDGVFLSVEWAPEQREYIWCTAVTKRDFARFFEISVVGEVIEDGRKSLVWLGKKRKYGFFAKLISMGFKD